MDSLQHYASPYYDPVKAHEYYEAHKKLKGRTSTAGLNGEGRKVASYVKSRITTEKKQRLYENTENRKTQINSRRDARDREVEAHKMQMNQKIESLRSQLKNKSRIDRERIRIEISDLRLQNQSKRESLMIEYKQEAAGIYTTARVNAEEIREDAANKYASELVRIKSEEKYQAKKKSGSKVSQERLDAFIKANLAERKKK